MPAYPDRDTLRLRRSDRRTPAEAARVVARELARRPAATRWDVSLSPPDRALAMFRENYPGLAERFHAGVLWAAAHGHGRPGARSTRRPCAWCLARAYARQQQQPAPRVDQLGLAVLGPACAACAPIVDPQPKPKPKPARSGPRSASGTNRTRAARSSTSTSSTRRARVPLTATQQRAAVAAYVAGGRVPATPTTAHARAVIAAAFPNYTPAERAAYNREALARQGVDPARYPHLTGGRP